MCFNKKIKKLQETVDELQKTIVTQELTKLRVESKDYAHVRENLANINLSLKGMKYIDDGTTNDPYIEIAYQPINVRLYIDNDGHISKNNFFIATNELNLLSQRDTEKLVKFINEVKEKYKKN